MALRALNATMISAYRRQDWESAYLAVEELATLNGIGEVLAKRIVAYRRRHGRFATPAEIMKVEGIGRTIYLKNMGRLRVEPPVR